MGTVVRTVGAAVMACLLAACGSTVQLTTPSTTSTGLDGGLAPGGGGAVVAPVAGPTRIRGTTTAADPTTPSVVGGSRLSVGPATTTSGLPARGRGFDETRVYLGFPTAKDLSSAATSLGLNSSLSYGDVEGAVRAILAEVNKRGGLLGRTVVPVFYDNKAADLQSDPDGTGQANCDYFTQDRPVVAVVNLVYQLDLDAFRTCLARRHTPLVSSSLLMTDSTIQQHYAPHLYKLTSPVFDRVIPVWLQRLKANGYFHGWDSTAGTSGSAPVKVGLLWAGMEPDRRQWRALRQRLSSEGYEVAATFEYDGSSLEAETGTIPQAVLPFRSAGVTHVLADRAAVLLFMQAAEQQRYRPRYALTTLHGTNVLLEPNAPPGQLKGALGVGWSPTADVSQANDPGDVGPGEAACRRTVAAAGVDVRLRSAEASAYQLCDGVHLMVDAARAVGGLSAEQLRQGIAAVGSSFSSAVVFRAAWSASRTDQPGAVRDLGWNAGCACFRYLSSKEFSL